MSRSSRRTVKVKQTISYAESTESEDSDQDMGWLELFAMAFNNPRRRKSGSARLSKQKNGPRKSQRTPRKRSNATTSSRARNIIVTNTTTVPLSSSLNNVSITTCINLDDSVIADQSKKVEDKVESFFKAHNLISDDEDDGDIPTKKAKCPPKDTKEFYELSDSDDDLKLTNFEPKPSTSNIKDLPSTSSINTMDNLDNILTCKNDELIDLVEIPPPSKDDELMDIVDKILESTDKPVGITSEKDQSWTDYKNKTEEILGNINNLLDDISKNAKPKTVQPEPTQQESQTSAKPTCPICLETLGGDLLTMTTTCGHLFCKMCIEKVAKTVKKCPTCRKAVNQKKIHPIYL